MEWTFTDILNKTQNIYIIIALNQSNDLQEHVSIERHRRDSAKSQRILNLIPSYCNVSLFCVV